MSCPRELFVFTKVIFTNHIFIKIFLLAFLLKNTVCLKCVDHNNNQVDWFVAYKFPIIKASDHQFVKEGLGYAYITSATKLSPWTLAEDSINDTQSLVGLSLAQLYQNQQTTYHISYNDESPNSATNAKKGHTKGVVLANETGGIWLVHSVPKFPPPPEEGYSYPHTGREFGQSFLCLSLDFKNLNKVGTQLQYNEPDIYSQNIPENAQFPELYKAAQNSTILSKPGFNIVDLETVGGTSFKSFAKNRSFLKDLYEDLLVPSLQDSLFVETWPNGPGRMRSNCSKSFSVKNVDFVSFNSTFPAVAFKSTHDHSKWAVTKNSGWLCIGDINRAVSQTKRGGGTVCQKNSLLAKYYGDVISLVENC